MIRKHLLLGALCCALLATIPASAATDPHPATKRSINLPPPAELGYAITAQQSGLTLNGDAVVRWQHQANTFSVQTEIRAAMLGKILDTSSKGMIDNYGLAPASFDEKRFRKDASTTTFNRSTRTIGFTQSSASFPLIGGEQDRASVIWQLIGIARAAANRFKPGSEWQFFVAGQRDAEAWAFKVIGREKIDTALGRIETVHLFRAPPPDDQDQKLDVWLAPGHDWYPVKLRFTDPDGDYIEQSLQTISKISR